MNEIKLKKKEWNNSYKTYQEFDLSKMNGVLLLLQREEDPMMT